jgi:hypothetical protein
MSAHDDGDVARDGLALVEAAHNGDFEGALAVLDNCDIRLVCGFLARVSCDLIESWTGPGDAGEMLTRMRRHYAGGGGG